jgi:hypothetical protein
VICTVKVWVLYKSIRRLDRNGYYPLIVITTSTIDELMMRRHCRALSLSGVLFVQTPKIPLPSFAKIPFKHWSVSMNKISGNFYVPHAAHTC